MDPLRPHAPERDVPEPAAQSGWGKRVRQASGLLSAVITELARDSPSWVENTRLIDSTPLPCGKSRETVSCYRGSRLLTPIWMQYWMYGPLSRKGTGIVMSSIGRRCCTPKRGRLGLRDYEKAYTPDTKAGVETSDERRVDRTTGALVIATPGPVRCQCACARRARTRCALGRHLARSNLTDPSRGRHGSNKDERR